MTPLVFDIETDGLYDEVTNIHCMSYTYDGEKYETVYDYDSIIRILSSGDAVPCGHNIGLYDLPVIKNLTGYEHQGLIIDTLFQSWYLEPNRIKHGLEDYGEEFGVPKIKVEDTQWKEGDLGLMTKRCERDTMINWKLLCKQMKVLKELYG